MISNTLGTKKAVENLIEDGISNADLEFITQKYSKILSAEFKKQNGVVYTPSWIAKHIVKNAISQWYRFNRHKGVPEIASDLSCGTGVFIGELLNQFKANGWNTHIHGKDKDINVIKLNKNTFSNYKDQVEFINQDVLFQYNSLFESDEKYDLIVGNPPYINSSFLDKKYKKTLSLKYRTAQTGSFDLSVVFVEKIINSLKRGGIASVILSNKFMTSSYGKTLSKILSSEVNILKIEDFHDIQMFDGFTTYTCIITFIKDKPGKRFVLRRYLSEINKVKEAIPDYIEETVLQNRLKEHPWNFCSSAEDEIIKICYKPNNPFICDVFVGIQQGIRTGANDVFVFHKDDQKNFESGILRPFIGGEDIKGLEVSHIGNYIVFPYKTEEDKVVPYNEYEMAKFFPVVYQYLVDNKQRLVQRSLQTSSYWFEFSRRQSLDMGFKKKILIKEMMPSAVFGIDLGGEYIFASGYAIDATNLEDHLIRAWAAVLSTPIMEFLMRHSGTQLHSGWFRLMKQHLEKLRLPLLTQSSLNKIASKIKNGDSSTTLAEINLMVANSFGLSDVHVKYILDYLARIHKRSKPKLENRSNYDRYEPVKLEQYNSLHIQRDDLRQEVTFVTNKKTPIHNWYKYTQGFSSRLVNMLLDELRVDKDFVILDPFNGCGTTTTVCAYRGIKSVGIEISPLMCLISQIKGRKWDIKNLRKSISKINSDTKPISMGRTNAWIFNEYLNKAYSSEILKQLNFISDLIKKEIDKEIKDFYTIGLLSILEDVSKIRKHGSHYRFLDNTQSIGLQKLNIELIDDDANVLIKFKDKLETIYSDICKTGGNPSMNPVILNQSILNNSLQDGSVDLIITSPPYLNRNNYIAQQKAELDILGLINTKDEYNRLVKSTFRSHTDSNLENSLSSSLKEVNLIISNLVLEDGNNPKIPHMICGYFEDLKQTIIECHRLLKKGGGMAFVVGNTRWGGIVVPIDHILAKIAEEIGFQVKSILITRHKGNSPQQMKKYGKIPVRESIIIFYKPK